MSKILRRPMFRGGAVDSRGTGITSGLGYEAGGRVGFDNGGSPFLRTPISMSGGQIVEAQKKKPFLNFDTLNDLNYTAGLSEAYKKTEPLKNIQLTDTSVEKEEIPTGDIFSNITDYDEVDTSSVFEGYESWEDVPVSIKNITSKNMFENEKQKEAKVTSDIQSDINAKGFLPKSGPLKGVVEVETDDKGGVKLTGGTTGNTEQKTELSARDLVRENAELFKEFLNEGNEKKLKDARIGDASDYLLKFFEGSQREGATVGSSAADVAAFATKGPSKTERAKAGIDKTNDTATVLAINDYIAGKRSKEQIEAMMAKSEIGFAQSIALADYNKKKDNFVDVVGELGRGMSNMKAIAGAVQKLFDKVPNSLTEKDTKLENFNLKQQENVGEYFIYPDGRVTTIIASGDGFIEDIVYAPQGITSGG